MKPYDILTVKNASVKSVYGVTECIINSFVMWHDGRKFAIWSISLQDFCLDFLFLPDVWQHLAELSRPAGTFNSAVYCVRNSSRKRHVLFWACACSLLTIEEVRQFKTCCRTACLRRSFTLESPACRLTRHKTPAAEVTPSRGVVLQHREAHLEDALFDTWVQNLTCHACDNEVLCVRCNMQAVPCFFDVRHLLL